MSYKDTLYNTGNIDNILNNYNSSITFKNYDSLNICNSHNIVHQVNFNWKCDAYYFCCLIFDYLSGKWQK